MAKLRITKDIVRRIKEARDYAKMERASFGSFSESEIRLTEAEVTDFIRDRTDLYRRSWIIGYLDSALRAIGVEDSDK